MALAKISKGRKICLFSLGAVILCGVIALCVYGIFSGGLTQEEKAYRKDPSEHNLIALCNSLMFTEQYDKKIEYIPKVLELDEKTFEEQYEKTKPAKQLDGEELGAYSAYREVLMEYLFAYIHTERYDELRTEFPEIFHLIVTRSADMNFGQHLGQTENLSDSDYRLFLEMLDECELGYIEPDKGSWDNLIEKQFNMETKAVIYLLLGDQEQYEYWDQKASEYNQWYLSVLKDKIAKGEIKKTN